jgi:HPt (histidine-containing phosphotransfer) domain-containing protein
MIDWEKFNETFTYFKNDVIIEVIDIYASELDERLAAIDSNIAEADFVKLKFNAHSFKGFVASFMDSEPYELCRKLEQMALNNEIDGLHEIFSKLKATSNSLLNELLAYRKTL